MKEVNAIVDGTIKMVNSSVIAEIIFNSGYFDEVEDISNQLSSDNTMVFSVFADLDAILGEPSTRSFSNVERSFEADEERLSEIIDVYMEIAVEDIVGAIKDELNIINITSSFSTSQMSDGISALIYVYFGEYYLNKIEFF